MFIHGPLRTEKDSKAMMLTAEYFQISASVQPQYLSAAERKQKNGYHDQVSGAAVPQPNQQAIFHRRAQSSQSRSIFNQELFSLCPPRLRGEFSYSNPWKKERTM